MERHVLVLITGGTICMQESADGLVPTRDFVKHCLQPRADFNDGAVNDTVNVVNEHGQASLAPTLQASSRSADLPRCRYSVLEFSDLFDSSEMNSSHWNTITRCLELNWAAFDGFVVLHGTDTLAYTASILAFMLGQIDKTVVITGSQLSMYAKDSDADDNLLDALTVAASYIVPEVSVVFHHHLYRGTRVTKVSSYSVAGFTTPNAKPLAIFPHCHDVSWTAHIHWSSIRSAPTADSSEFLRRIISKNTLESQLILDTSRVAVLKVYPGISAMLINTILQIPMLGGLVLETFGAGNLPLGSGNLDILAAAVKKGVVIVSVTQCLTGSVTSAYESAHKMEQVGVVTGLDMTTEAAYTKLVYLLSLPDLDHIKIAETMRQDLRGELTADFREGQKRRDSITRANTSQPAVV